MKLRGTREGRKFDEEYARRYLIAFTSFRDESDLSIHGSYKKRLQHAHADNELTDYLEIMQNIQNIRNSLDAGRMSEDLPTFDTEENDPESHEEESGLDVTNLIATYFATATADHVLQEEPTNFDFPKSNFSNESGNDAGDIWHGEPKNVLRSATKTDKPKEPEVKLFKERTRMF